MRLMMVRASRMVPSLLTLSMLNGCSQSMSFKSGPSLLETSSLGSLSDPSAAVPAAASSAPSTSSASSAASVSATCGGSLVDTQVSTKLLFIVDTSGSNANASSANGMSDCAPGATDCTPATDPFKTFRDGSIEGFFTKYKDKTNFSWSFATFASQAVPYIADSSGHAIFTSDSNRMQSAITQFLNAADGGGTSYSSALSLAAQTIANDPDLHGASHPNYLVILMTDGFPMDYTDSSGQLSLSLLQSDIAKITSLEAGRVSLNTVYYGSKTVQTAIGLLETMAGVGGGQFANASGSNPTFSIDSTLMLPNCLSVTN